MAIPSHDEILSLKEALQEDYGGRLDSMRRLRELWHGNWYDDTNVGLMGGLDQFVGAPRNIGPDLRVVRNFLHEICVKYQSYFTQLPMITVPVDSPHTDTRKKQAARKERALYGLWEEGNMNYWHNQLGWFLPLMGDAFLGIWPDFERNIVRPLVRSPEIAYPLPGFDMTNPYALDGIIFVWKVKRAYAERSFPQIRGKLKAQPQPRMMARGHRPKVSDEVEIVEYFDTDCLVRYVDTIRVNAVEHYLGFNLFDQAQFVNVPGEVWGHGAVEQMVGMNELSNATLGLVWQAMLENVYPRLVLIDPAKAPEQIASGPGAVIPINQGGNVAWLHPPVEAINAQAGWLVEMERGMKELAAMPDVNFGNIRASIVTGRAVNELQGAGTGSIVEMVQGSGLGGALVSWNSKALVMLRQMFEEDTIALGGWAPRDHADMNPKAFAMSFKGSEIVGSNKNRVAYGPAMDLHTKLVMQLQALGAGLISRSYAREQIGIADSDAMEEEIFQETIQDGVLRTFIAAMEQGISPEQAKEMEAGGIGYISGQAGMLPPPVPAGEAMPQMPPGVDMAGLMAPGGGGPAPGGPMGLPPSGAPMGGPPPGAEMLPGGLPPGAVPPGEPPPGAGAPAVPPGAPPPGTEAGLPPEMSGLFGGAGGEVPPQEVAAGASPAGIEEPQVTLDQMLPAFASLEGVEGRVFLVGEIVAAGVARMLEVAVTVGSDRGVIMGQMPDMAEIMSFTVVPGLPNEPYVEVTPGTEPTFGGEEPDMAGFFA